MRRERAIRRGVVAEGTCLILVLILIMFLLVCAGAGTVTYKSPIGLALVIDGDGNVTLTSTDIEVPTPIGTFAFNARYTKPNVPVLKVIIGDKVHLFRLQKGKQYQLAIPNDRNGESKIEVEPSGDITVTIPDPIWKRPVFTIPSPSSWEK